MKIAFWGTGEFSLAILQALYYLAEIDVLGIISRPNKPIGRKKIIQDTPVAAFAKEKSINLYQPSSLKKLDTTHEIYALDVDFFVVASFGAIIPQSMLDIPRLGAINVHTSLLPKYRGASPIQTAIKNGDTSTGVTIMYMDKKMDEGDIILQQEIDIPENMHSQELFRRLQDISPNLLISALHGIYNNKINSIKQDHSNATYAGIIQKTDGKIDFGNMDSYQIYNSYRAFSTWPKIYGYFLGKKVIFEKIQLTNKTSTIDPGIIYEQDGDYYMNGADHKALKIEEIKIEGKKSMDIKSAINGNPDLLTTKFT